jgi:hypothetical protein
VRVTSESTNLYANISYVDLVAAPISMRTDGSSGSQSVSPLPAGALSSIASGLVTQYQTDGAPWNSLAVTNSNGTVLAGAWAVSRRPKLCGRARVGLAPLPRQSLCGRVGLGRVTSHPVPPRGSISRG